jgi:hypothetical protein
MRTRKKPTVKKPVRSGDVPATSGMLYEMESRLDFKIETLRTELRAESSSLRSEMKAAMSKLNTSLRAEIHRIGLLVEEQNARNKFVLDGYAQLHEFIKEKLA